MEIGARLKEAREQKNLSLNDIQQVTKIQTRYLQAIEKGNYNVMPGNFYVRAFIKEYAAAVGLDAEQLIEEHKNELPATSDESSAQYTSVQRSRKESHAPSKSPAIFSFLPTLVVVLLIIGIVFLVWYFYQSSLGGDGNGANQPEDSVDEYLVNQDKGETGQNGDNEEGNNTDDTSDEATDTSGEDSNEEEPAQEQEPELNLVEQGTQGNDQVSTFELVNPGEEIIVEVNTDATHWLQIANGENEVYGGMFDASQAPLTEDLSDAEQIMIRFGNPAQIDITVGGVPLEMPEDMNPSQVQRVWINIGGDAAAEEN
ncbi:helix-turn-helix domain-containing protein [Sediminibacillus massiliensis]|uniref:helix-turn-helix domain-containing protein n=1 Tax=Sediminibacillus massiliensis TaxID=1926277 RepID=UPI0015C408F4|nr:helix-turn-helix domain-containing protein [Sediminibacillus massiliensis]